MGTELSETYKDKNPIFLSVLNGAFMFAADLLRACPIACELNFVKLSSYEGTATTGQVQTVIGLDKNIEGRHIIILEDIIDTGTTMHHFLKTIARFKPASVRLVTLLFKPDALVHDLNIDSVGFEIPNKFVVGYGLDYNEQGRNIKSIYQLVEKE